VQARSADAGQNFQRFVLDFNAREEKYAAKRRKDPGTIVATALTPPSPETYSRQVGQLQVTPAAPLPHRLREVQRLTSLADRGSKDIREAHLRPGKECLKRNLAGWSSPESTGSSIDDGQARRTSDQCRFH
jgi:hypothetical protein